MVEFQSPMPEDWAAAEAVERVVQAWVMAGESGAVAAAEAVAGY